MSFQSGKVYHGFELIDQYPIDEVKSMARIFQHKKSGARLLHLENDDDNKVFSIGFRTPPTDSTGVPHIVEHCVLSGSRKYKTKEPFMDMVKGSLQTFINAMTFSDKTIYPVASRNKKDFYNLMDVYLDAVFYPSIYEIPEIFMQEGWHYELNNKDEQMKYKGVVYNEMRGAYSSPETILEETIQKSLYPDTCYKYSSGGNPYIIPDLTYEDFLNFHKKFYHPVNSYIYLYGNGDVLEQLKFIDEGYLSNFEKIDIDSEIKPQSPFKSMEETEEYYSVSKEESDENKTYLSLNFVLGDNRDAKTYLMSSILKDLLIESSAAPLKKALVKAGIGEDILHIDTDGIQPSFCVAAKNTSMDKKNKFKEVVFNTLKDLVSNGIDKKLISACINMTEYSLREATGFPTKGIIYHINSLDSWLYDSDPTTHIRYEETLKELRNLAKSNYFEKFIEENIINNPHSSLVVMNPKKGLAEEKDKELQQRLDKHKESLSDKEIEELIEANKKLRDKQLSPDSKEARDTIPKLSVSDVNSKSQVIPQDVIKDEDVTLLFHDIFTSKIGYVDLLFDVSMVSEDLIPYINLLSKILGKVDTKTMDYSELSNEIYVNTGGIKFNTEIYIENGKDDVFYPKFKVKGKAIGDKITSLINLTKELITSSIFDDKERIKELISQTKSRLEMSIFNRGHSVASRRVASYYSKSSKYSELLNGLDFYWFISDITKNFDSNSDNIIRNIKKVYNMIFNKNNLIISFTGDKDDFSLFRENLNKLTDDLDNTNYGTINYNFEKSNLNEGILSNANVQYVAKGYNFKDLGYEYNGNMKVLSTILSVDYLHNRIRAKGGAYGCGINFGRSGNMTTFSYRDPNLSETIDVYDKTYDYVEDLELDNDEFTSYIIGTISRLDSAQTPHMMGITATKNYICNITDDDVQRERSEVLNSKIEDIRPLSELLKTSMEENYCCVLGNEDKIKENKGLFNTLVNLNK